MPCLANASRPNRSPSLCGRLSDDEANFRGCQLLPTDQSRTDGPMTRATLALAALTIALSGPALAEPLAPTGGAGNTGVTAPSLAPGNAPRARETDLRPAPNVVGNPSPNSVPGSSPGVNIGGTPTSGPPGTGGTAGGPSIGAQ